MGEPATKLQPDRQWKQATGVVQAELGPGQTAVLHLMTGRYHALNGVGSRIWALLAQPRAMSEICGRLCAEYDVGYDRCTQEVERYMSMMHGLQLVEPIA